MERNTGIELDRFIWSWSTPAAVPSTPGLDLGGVAQIPGRLEFTVRQTQFDEVYAMPLEVVCEYPTGETDTLRVFNDERIQSFAFRLPRSPRQLQLDPRGWS